MTPPTATASPATTTTTADAGLSADLDRRRAQRLELKSRHASSLTRLMDERTDLRGVHALADFVDDAVRWTA